ncbi:Chitin synthase 4 [Malassezia sp. CBS 17886]|nr:Chitin synthase 4 [Malassezia sp. CBS 17886]
MQPTVPIPLAMEGSLTPGSMRDAMLPRQGYSTAAGGTGNAPVPADERGQEAGNPKSPTAAPDDGPLLDHSHLQPGNHASLLSHGQTLDMYRKNAKKTNDPQLNYGLSVFMLDVARSLESVPDHPVSPDSEPAAEREALIKEATGILKRLADRGHCDSQYLIGDCYANGFGTSKGKVDFSQAYSYFTLAAKHGHPDAAYRAGTCYEKGWGCRRDAGKAVQFYRKAASQGHPGAQYRLGTAELNGELGLKRSAREGVKWLKRSAESATPEFPHALHELALLHEKGIHNVLFSDPEYSCELLAQAAEMGYAPSAYKLGVNYEYGRMGCPLDGGLSIHMYNIAAQQNHKEACFALTAWYLVGAPGILPQSDTEAFLWAKRAAKQGMAKAEYSCGYFSEMGVGTRKDLGQAKGWYVLAAEHGDKRAHQRLASLAGFAAKKVVENDEGAQKKSESSAVPVQPLSAPFPGSTTGSSARSLGVLKYPTPKAMRETQAFQRDMHFQALVAATTERERSKEREAFTALQSPRAAMPPRAAPVFGNQQASSAPRPSGAQPFSGTRNKVVPITAGPAPTPPQPVRAPEPPAPAPPTPGDSPASGADATPNGAAPPAPQTVAAPQAPALLPVPTRPPGPPDTQRGMAAPSQPMAMPGALFAGPPPDASSKPADGPGTARAAPTVRPVPPFAPTGAPQRPAPGGAPVQPSYPPASMPSFPRSGDAGNGGGAAAQAGPGRPPGAPGNPRHAAPQLLMQRPPGAQTPPGAPGGAYAPGAPPVRPFGAPHGASPLRPHGDGMGGHTPGAAPPQNFKGGHVGGAPAGTPNSGRPPLRPPGAPSGPQPSGAALQVPGFPGLSQGARSFQGPSGTPGSTTSGPGPAGAPARPPSIVPVGALAPANGTNPFNAAQSAQRGNTGSLPGGTGAPSPGAGTSHAPGAPPMQRPGAPGAPGERAPSGMPGAQPVNSSAPVPGVFTRIGGSPAAPGATPGFPPTQGPPGGAPAGGGSQGGMAGFGRPPGASSGTLSPHGAAPGLPPPQGAAPGFPPARGAAAGAAPSLPPGAAPGAPGAAMPFSGAPSPGRPVLAGFRPNGAPGTPGGAMLPQVRPGFLPPGGAAGGAPSPGRPTDALGPPQATGPTDSARQSSETATDNASMSSKQRKKWFSRS